MAKLKRSEKAVMAGLRRAPVIHDDVIFTLPGGCFKVGFFRGPWHAVHDVVASGMPPNARLARDRTMQPGRLFAGAL
jgi:hypothetical protein